jgi:hypothetical protein
MRTSRCLAATLRSNAGNAQRIRSLAKRSNLLRSVVGWRRPAPRDLAVASTDMARPRRLRVAARQTARPWRHPDQLFPPASWSQLQQPLVRSGPFQDPPPREPTTGIAPPGSAGRLGDAPGAYEWGLRVFWMVANGSSQPRHATTGRAVALGAVELGRVGGALLRPRLGVADPLPNDIFDQPVGGGSRSSTRRAVHPPIHKPWRAGPAVGAFYFAGWGTWHLTFGLTPA